MSKTEQKNHPKNIKKSTPKNVEKKHQKATSKSNQFSVVKKQRKNIDFRGVKIPDAPKTEKSIFSENVGKY